MNKPAWSEIENIFHQALAIPNAERASLVRELSRGDPQVIHEVESLLQAYSDDDAWFRTGMESDLQEILSTTMNLLTADPMVEQAKPTRVRTQDAAELSRIESLLGSRFRLERILGRGGTGVVVQARDTFLRRRVAVKLLRVDAESAKVAAKSMRESRAMAALQSDHIVQIYEVIVNSACPALVMELIRGPSVHKLQQRLKRFRPRFAAEIALQTAQGLAHSHDQRQLHGDIKPSNVIIQRRAGTKQSWRAKIIDFGLTRALESDPTRTLESKQFGTPMYMCPEQLLHAGMPDERSDIYSLGVMLYEMLAGEPPFRGSPAMIIRQIESFDPRRLTQLDEQVSLDLESICFKAMSKEPAERYANAKEFAADLQRFLNGEPTMARPLPKWTIVRRWASRNQSIAWSLAIMTISLILLTVGSTIAAFTFWGQNLQIAKQKALYSEALIEKLPSSDPSYVPEVVAQIQQQVSSPIPHLRASWDAQTELQAQLNLACALSLLGEPYHDFLVENIAKCITKPGQCRALLAALETNRSRSLALLKKQYSLADSMPDRVKMAMIAYYLGDTHLANEIHDSPSRVEEHTLWIHLLADWHELDSTIKCLKLPQSKTVQAATLLGLGQIDPSAYYQRDLDQLSQTLKGLLKDQDSSGSRSAAKWLAHKLKERLPVETIILSSNHALPDMSFEMILVRGGTFQMGRSDASTMFEGNTSHSVTLTRDYWLADREVTVGEFKKFLSETATTIEDQAQWSPDHVISPTDFHPAQSLTWDQAVRFCNWLSKRQGLEEVYKRDGTEEIKYANGQVEEVAVWRHQREANGFRLPTEAEYEFAARAGTNSEYFFGRNRRLLEYYASWSNNTRVSTHVGGSSMPNQWGFFDLLGNVWELTEDWYREFPADPETDPRNLDFSGAGKVIRGGGVCTYSGDPVCGSRGWLARNAVSINAGFRVARNAK